MPEIVDTLAQRGSVYGDFREQGRITQNLKRAMQDSPNWATIPDYMKEGLDMVQHKVSRLLNGDALYDDNLHDMVGYTKLMQDRAAQDRANGAMFITGGDKLYPVYKHSTKADEILEPATPVKPNPNEWDPIASLLRVIGLISFCKAGIKSEVKLDLRDAENLVFLIQEGK